MVTPTTLQFGAVEIPRDEYVRRPRPDTLLQIEQRLDDLLMQREELRHRIENSRHNE